jgi:hypothetical protein
LNILEIAYLDSIGWDFDEGVLNQELLFGMDSPFEKTLLEYHEKLYTPWKPRKRSKNMDSFEIVYREYLDSISQEKPDLPQHPSEEVPNQKFCFEGHKHQFINIGGERTCNECGLVSGLTSHVSEYECWNRARMNGPDRSSVTFKFDSFCQRKNITAYSLLGGRTREVLENIENICDAEKPKRKRLPNLNILTYQVCKRLGVEIDKSLLKIPKGKIPHDRCKKIFQTLGWDYFE